MGTGKNSPRGRNLSRAGQQEHFEHLLSPSETLKKSQPYTPRGSAVKKPTPAKEKPRLSAKDKLECFQKFYAWVHDDKKKTKSPEAELRKNYLDFKLGKNYFYDLLKRNTKGGTIFARSPPGRPPAYGQKYDDLILKCVKEQRAKQQCAPVSFIRKAMLKKNWSEVPTEQWIVGRKQALGIIRVQIKLKPKLNERLYAARLEVAKW